MTRRDGDAISRVAFVRYRARWKQIFNREIVRARARATLADRWTSPLDDYAESLESLVKREGPFT